MIEFQNFLDFIGHGNALTILVFIIGVFIAFYFYFRTFFRLVYSTNRICLNCHQFGDWQNEDSDFITRVLIYNNGKKTLSQTDVKKLEIDSDLNILDFRIICGNDNLTINQREKKITLNFDHLDSRKYFVIEVKHKGFISIDGRVSETGEILSTEPKSWLIFNIISIIILAVFVCYNFFIIINNNDAINVFALINIAFLYGIYWIIRFIHSLLFIPDSLTAKYLDSKDKWNKSFKTEF